MGIVTAVISGKGGTGKTTVTSGLGKALAKRGHKVLLIDCDFCIRGLDLVLGIDGDVVFDISDIVSGNCPPASAVYPCPTVSGLYVLPSSQSTENDINVSVMSELVKVLSKDYDYVLIDSQTGIGTGFELALAGAQQALIVANAEQLAVRGCDKARRQASERGIKDIRLIINRFSERAFWEMNEFEDLDAVIDKVSARLIGIVPEDNKRSLKMSLAFDRIASRLDGEDVRLIIE